MARKSHPNRARQQRVEIDPDPPGVLLVCLAAVIGTFAVILGIAWWVMS